MGVIALDPTLRGVQAQPLYTAHSRYTPDCRLRVLLATSAADYDVPNRPVWSLRRTLQLMRP
jgi:hypothetical protein